MQTYIIHYDDLNLENATIDTIDAYYDAYPLYKTCDIIDVESDDIYEAYDEALQLSDHELDISHVQVLQGKKWVNWHEVEDLYSTACKA
jgi:hypothetical protein